MSLHRSSLAQIGGPLWASAGPTNLKAHFSAGMMMVDGIAKMWHEGRTEVAPAIREIARTLQAGYPTDLALVTGLALRTADDELAVADLVLITTSALLVGVNTARAAVTLSPREVGKELLRREQSADISPIIRVYACWLGAASPAGTDDGSPLLSNATQVADFLRRSSAQNEPADSRLMSRLAAHLIAADKAGARLGPPTPPVQRALRRVPGGWLRRDGVRPADVSKRLRVALLDRKNHLEDARYGKVVPNLYTVVINDQEFAAHFEPIAADLCEQWRLQLLQDLNTANSRQGRKQYRFGGAVTVRLQPDATLAADEIRIDSQVQRDPRPEQLPPPSSLSPAPEPSVPGAVGTISPARAGVPRLTVEDQTFILKDGLNMIGRSRQCDLVVPGEEVQSRRLVSGLHAHIICTANACRIYDGTPDGKSSLNGTFVNRRVVPKNGQPLRDGDEIILAAVDRSKPRPDTPGVVKLIFHF